MQGKKRIKVKDLLLKDEEREGVLIKGWVRTRRDSKGGFSFLEVNDGSCLKNLQIIADHNLESFKSVSGQLTTGSCVAVSGNLVRSKGKEQGVEMQAVEIAVLGGADTEKYPLQKKRHSFEFLREIAHLRPRTNTFGAVMRVRNRLAYSIHKFFHDR